MAELVSIGRSQYNVLPKILHRSVSKISREYKDFCNKMIVRRSLKHICGSKYISLPDNEVVVILLGRNMAHYLEYFHDYYSRMGVKYFIYADNGSTDRTIDIVSRWSNTVVLATDLNFRAFQTPIRQEISTRFCSEGWRLAVDPDELFDYVGSDKLSVVGLTKTLEDRGYNGLAAQMLDMVSDEPLYSLKSFEENAKDSKYYTLENISSFEYKDRRVPFSQLADRNKVQYGTVCWKYGGLRNKYFGENCCLTKHPLFLYKSGVKPFQHPHLTTGLQLADFTALLRHYKFSGNFIDREYQLLKENRISHVETAQRAAVIESNENFTFDVSLMDNDSSPLNLVSKGFLSMSEQAMKVYV